MNNTGPFLERLREAAKLNRRQLGQAAGIDPSIISRAERGESRLRPANLRSILSALGIKADSPAYTEAFALHAADAAYGDGVVPLGKPFLAKSIAVKGKLRDEQERRMIDAFRSLSPERRDALLFALYFPDALDGIAAIQRAAVTAGRHRK